MRDASNLRKTAKIAKLPQYFTLKYFAKQFLELIRGGVKRLSDKRIDIDD